MVSKSSNYCGITDDEGYLLLSEVALGQIQEERHSDDQIKKPSKGKSSVKGLGQIVPNKLQHQVTKDGINVPIGEPIVRKNGFRNYPLLYNEYIVYDEAQVKMKYLIKAKFNSK
uniref:Poly [ADP-ribose] polymerase n=1 Tax=Panagrolaimus sp. PS1159 TaxID=55785 RepID=A0AC35F307_9BILA